MQYCLLEKEISFVIAAIKWVFSKVCIETVDKLYNFSYYQIVESFSEQMKLKRKENTTSFLYTTTYMKETPHKKTPHDIDQTGKESPYIEMSHENDQKKEVYISRNLQPQNHSLNLM